MNRRGFLGLLTKGAALVVAAPVVLKTLPVIAPTEPAIDETWCERCGAYHSRAQTITEMRAAARCRLGQWLADEIDRLGFEAFSKGIAF